MSFTEGNRIGNIDLFLPFVLFMYSPPHVLQQHFKNCEFWTALDDSRRGCLILIVMITALLSWRIAIPAPGYVPRKWHKVTHPLLQENSSKEKHSSGMWPFCKQCVGESAYLEKVNCTCYREGLSWGSPRTPILPFSALKCFSSLKFVCCVPWVAAKVSLDWSTLLIKSKYIRWIYCRRWYWSLDHKKIMYIFLG